MGVASRGSNRWASGGRLPVGLFARDTARRRSNRLLSPTVLASPAVARVPRGYRGVKIRRRLNIDFVCASLAGDGGMPERTVDSSPPTASSTSGPAGSPLRPTGAAAAYQRRRIHAHVLHCISPMAACARALHSLTRACARLAASQEMADSSLTLLNLSGPPIFGSLQSSSPPLHSRCGGGSAVCVPRCPPQVHQRAQRPRRATRTSFGPMPTALAASAAPYGTARHCRKKVAARS